MAQTRLSRQTSRAKKTANGRKALSATPSFCIVGAGSFGSVLARSLAAAGFRLDELVARDSAPSLARAKRLGRSLGAAAAPLTSAKWNARVVWLCVPDDAIAGIVEEMARTGKSWGRKIVLHSSGALASDVLQPLRKQGAAVASAHPLMTFVAATRRIPRGVPFAVEGDKVAVAMARTIVRRLGGNTFFVPAQNRTAYHAFATFTSPMLVALFAAMENAASLAGLSSTQARKVMAPILRTTLENYLERGAAASFSGPLRRGDAQIIIRHLNTLSGTALEGLYRELGQAALGLTPAEHREKVAELLSKRHREGRAEPD